MTSISAKTGARKSIGTGTSVGSVGVGAFGRFITIMWAIHAIFTFIDIFTFSAIMVISWHALVWITFGFSITRVPIIAAASLTWANCFALCICMTVSIAGAVIH